MWRHASWRCDRQRRRSVAITRTYQRLSLATAAKSRPSAACLTKGTVLSSATVLWPPSNQIYPKHWHPFKTSCASSKILGLCVLGMASSTTNRRQSFPHKSCVLCKAVDCRYLPQSDKKPLGWSRLVTYDVCEEDDDDLYDGDTVENVFSDPAVRLVERNPVSHRVGVVQSSVLYTFFRQHPMAITLDTGTTTNMIQAFTARVCKLTITPASQFARQADSVTPLDVIGEIHSIVTTGSLSFQFGALLVRQLDVDILTENPFLAMM